MVHKKTFLYIFITLLWMFVIFGFSADPADDSSKKSLGIGYAIAHFFVPGFDTWETEKQQNFVEDIEFPIRKAGHATEYAVLGFLCMGMLCSFDNKQRKKWLFLIAWGITILYAVSDELHQLFVPGRSCQFSDVCLDSGGALVGIGMYFLLKRLCKRLFPQSDFCGKLIDRKNDRRNGV